MRVLAIVVFLFFTSCTSPERETVAKAEQSNNEISTNSTDLKQNQILTPLSSAKEILGIWIAKNKEELIVKIDKDSIYYPEHSESHKYSLKGDSIFISYPDLILRERIGFLKDTMVFNSADGQSRFVRKQ